MWSSHGNGQSLQWKIGLGGGGGGAEGASRTPRPAIMVISHSGQLIT